MPWLFLRAGQRLDHAHRAVRDLLLALPGVEAQAAIGNGARPAADAFIRWTETAELQLRSIFDEDPSRDLFDERYWRIREIKDDSVRPFPLISSAIRRQEARLQEVLDQLATYEHVCGTSDTIIAILDTNIYDHYQLFTQINWSDVLRAKSVRLLVPLVVVDELDGQKDNRESRLGKRAGKVIKALRGLPFVEGERGPRVVRAGVELDYLPEPPGHVRRASNDDEVVRQAAYIASIAPNRVRLITGDLGMQIRAMNQDVPHLLMPDNYLATSETTP